jgi:hypothetical protein
VGVDKIHVGFMQHINVATLRSFYTTRYLVSAMEGKGDMLDADDPTQFFSTTLPDAVFFNATATINGKEIAMDDSPAFPVPVRLNVGGMFQNIRRIEWDFRFSLAVAAETTDPLGNPDSSNKGRFWAEATANWSFSGTIPINVVVIGGRQAAVWAAGASAFVHPPRAGGAPTQDWTIPVDPIVELVSGLVANVELLKRVFTSRAI